MRILAIDYGEKRIGTAISDPLGITAQPLEVIEKDGREIERIKNIVKEKTVEKILIGLPVNMSGTLGDSANRALEFSKKLGESVKIDIEMADERLSTWEANRIMIDFDISRKKRKSKVDKVAATIILQTWLSKNNPKENNV